MSIRQQRERIMSAGVFLLPPPLLLLPLVVPPQVLLVHQHTERGMRSHIRASLSSRSICSSSYHHHHYLYYNYHPSCRLCRFEPSMDDEWWW